MPAYEVHDPSTASRPTTLLVPLTPIDAGAAPAAWVASVAPTESKSPHRHSALLNSAGAGDGGQPPTDCELDPGSGAPPRQPVNASAAMEQTRLGLDMGTS